MAITQTADLIEDHDFFFHFLYGIGFVQLCISAQNIAVGPLGVIAAHGCRFAHAHAAADIDYTALLFRTVHFLSEFFCSDNHRFCRLSSCQNGQVADIFFHSFLNKIIIAEAWP